MSNEQKQLIREKFETKEWNQSYCCALYMKEIADFWLNELDLATKETERVTEERLQDKIRKEINTEIHKEGQSKERIGGLHKARAIVANILSP